jgi:hypothetical protein
MYLASQTVALVAELINSEGNAGQASGKVLFFSTIGSVAGGVITPVWLFPSIGVTRSTYVVCILLVGAAGVMALGRFRAVWTLAVSAVTLAVMVSAHALASPGHDLFSFDSAYQSIRIVEERAENGRMERVLIMGGGRASGIYTDNGETSFPYVRAAEQALAETNAAAVLAIGSAGFTFPRDVASYPQVKQLDAVDVDPVVWNVAQREFLKHPLPAKIRFLPWSARYAVRKLNKDGNHYGFTLVDAYFGHGIPDELVTMEFFHDIRLLSERTAVNVIMDSAMESAFAKNLLASFRAGFGAAWVQDVDPDDSDPTNIMVTSWPAAGSVEWKGSGEVYRDNRNSASLDHVKLVWGADRN